MTFYRYIRFQAIMLTIVVTILSFIGYLEDRGDFVSCIIGWVITILVLWVLFPPIKNEDEQ